MTSIPELEAAKRKAHEVFSKADAALHKGTITPEERNRILTHYYGTTNEQEVVDSITEEIATMRQHTPANKSVALVASFCLVMLSLFAVLFYSTGGITGAVVLNISEVNTTYTSNTDIPIQLNGTTRINVTGTASGTGDVTITLLHEGVAYTLYTYRNGIITTAHASMKAHYSAGEQVSFSAENLSSAYLITADDALLLDGTTIEGLAPGTYTLKLIINDTELTQESLTFTIHEGVPAVEERFNSCGDGCDLGLSGAALLKIETFEAAVTLDQIILSTQANNAPQLIADIPDATGIGSATVDIAGVFADPDGDALIYESTHHEGNNEEFDAERFTVSGPAGTYTYIVYASDMADLTPSNIFSITLLENVSAPANSTNGTMEENTTEINVTPPAPEPAIVNATNATNATTPGNMTANQTFGCDEPDPNKRPLECIQNESSTYFRPEDLFIENKDGVVVGKLTPIGNMLIRGGIVERSTATPGNRDWVRGYENANGDFVATIWIDSQSGDLHIANTLTEANTNIVFEPGLTALMNERGIILALINARAGDLVVRGNVIPYRRSFE